MLIDHGYSWLILINMVNDGVDKQPIMVLVMFSGGFFHGLCATAICSIHSHSSSNMCGSLVGYTCMIYARISKYPTCLFSSCLEPCVLSKVNLGCAARTLASWPAWTQLFSFKVSKKRRLPQRNGLGTGEVAQAVQTTRSFAPRTPPQPWRVGFPRGLSGAVLSPSPSKITKQPPILLTFYQTYH